MRMYKITQSDGSVAYVESLLPLRGGEVLDEPAADEVRAKVQPGPQDRLVDIAGRLATLEANARKPTTP